MEAIQNLKMVEAARAEAQTILKSDPNLDNHPKLAERIKGQTHQTHFE
jgi:hypothetical protein